MYFLCLWLFTVFLYHGGQRTRENDNSKAKDNCMLEEKESHDGIYIILVNFFQVSTILSINFIPMEAFSILGKYSLILFFLKKKGFIPYYRMQIIVEGSQGWNSSGNGSKNHGGTLATASFSGLVGSH